MDLPKKELRLTRDRITALLETYLGRNDAVERANNITQALLLAPEGPAIVAFEMLARLDLGDPWAVAVQVEEVWNASHEALRREGHIAGNDTDPPTGPYRDRTKSGVREVDSVDNDTDNELDRIDPMDRVRQI